MFNIFPEIAGGMRIELLCVASLGLEDEKYRFYMKFGFARALEISHCITIGNLLIFPALKGLSD